MSPHKQRHPWAKHPPRYMQVALDNEDAQREADRAALTRALALDDKDGDEPGGAGIDADTRAAFENMLERLGMYRKALTDKQRAYVQAVLERNGEVESCANLVSNSVVPRGDSVAPAPALMHRPLAPPGRNPTPPNAIERRFAELRKETT